MSAFSIQPSLDSLEVNEIEQLVQEFSDKLDQLLAQHGLSLQISPSDELIPYDNDSLQLLKNIAEQFKELPTNLTKSSQIAMKLGCTFSSSGNLLQAEHFFIQSIENNKNNIEKALAYFNLFQVRWRKAFIELKLADQEQIYAEALIALQHAIELSNRRYALHDIQKYYPMLKLLGVDSMGCALLCENHNVSFKEHQHVVVKCFWENISRNLEQIFKKPLAMNEIAGDSVATMLDFGYADKLNKQGVYLVTEYVEGAIDGETWLGKKGPLDFATGLQVARQIAETLQKAHEQGIYHLDLKPLNILIKKSNDVVSVKIFDFGIASVTTSLRHGIEQRNYASLTVFGQVMRNLSECAPPEQRGYAHHFGQPGAASDIFAFGKTMYRLLTGEIPLAVEEEPLAQVPHWYKLLAHCTRQNPKKRPDLQTVLEDLKSFEKLESEPVAQPQKVSKAQPQAQLEGVKSQLSSLNPLDYLRLLWWTLVRPQTLKEYRNRFGTQDEKHLGNWVTSTLIWLPLFIPTLALGLGFIPSTNQVWSSSIYLSFSLMLGGCWLLTSWLGEKEEDLFFLLAIGIAFLVTSSVVSSMEVELSLAIYVAALVAIGMAISGAISVAVGMAFGVAFGIAAGTTIMVMGMVGVSVIIIFMVTAFTLNSLDFKWNIGVLLFLTGSVAGSVAGVMMDNVWIGVAVAVAIPTAIMGIFSGVKIADAVKKSLETGTPSWFARLALVVLVLDYLYLIYYCFLGGWRWFV
jgi:serine/threonine protein kinase